MAEWCALNNTGPRLYWPAMRIIIKNNRTSGIGVAMEVIEFPHTGLLSFKSFRRTSTGNVSTSDPPLIREIVIEMDAVVCNV